MLVLVGSTNKTKVEAVAAALAAHERFQHAEVRGIAVEIPEFGHPKTLDETLKGAMDRAIKAFQECEYGVGIEAGLMQVPHTKTGYMEFAACAIYDGTQHHLGLSPGFEWPTKALHAILHKGLDGSQAVKEAGFTDHPKLGMAEGIVGILTNGVIPRQKQNEMAVHMALMHLLHPEHY